MPLPPIRFETSRFQKDINDLIQWIGSLVAPGGGAVPSTRTITAGEGLTGGGDLSTDRTIDMGTPDTLTPATTNSTTAGSHTHEVTGFQPTLTEGADIDISAGNLIQRKGNGILLFSGAGALLGEYAYTSAGLIAALAAATSGDVVKLPAGTITGNVTIGAGVTLRGLSRTASIIAGMVTLGVGSIIENLTIQNIGDSAGALYGVVSAASGTAKLINVSARCENSTGSAYALYMAAGGNVSCYEAELLAQVGTNGYAAYMTSGTFTHYSGRAVGTTATYPYYM